MGQNEQPKILKKTLSIEADKLKKMKQIMADLNLHSFSALFNLAVSLLCWYRDQKKAGFKIFAINETTMSARELIFEPLDLALEEDPDNWAEELEDLSNGKS